MKKLLAMVLALVMTLSLAVSASAFKDDKDVSADYAEAVAVLNGMGVFKGYEDGSFQPKGDITRAEVATILYRIYTGDVAKSDKSGLYSTYNKFSDMTGAGWAAGYIGYCANAELVKGYPDGTFKPSGKITGYEVLAMILRAIGYDKNGEFSGADWALNVAKYAEQLGILKNVDKATNLGAAATRELVAEMLFAGIQKDQVTYTPAFGYQTDKAFTLGTTSLGKKNFELDSKPSSDDWGRPATKWTYNTGDEETLFVATPDASFTVATTECDICEALGVKKSADVVEIYTNGVKGGTDKLTATETKNKLGAQGQLIEFYENKDGDYRMVVIDTYLALVTDVVTEKVDSKNHVTRDDYTKFEAYVGVDKQGNTEAKYVYVAGNDYAEDDYVLVNINDAKTDVKFVGLTGTQNYIEVVGKAESFEGAQTKNWYNSAKHTIDDKDYEDAVCFYLDGAKTTETAKFTWFLDQYGNLIGDAAIDSTNYAVLKDMLWITGKPGHAEATLVYMDGKEDTVEVSYMDGFKVSTTASESNWLDNGTDLETVLADNKTDVGFKANTSGKEDGTAAISSEGKLNDMYEGLALYRVDSEKDGTVSLSKADITYVAGTNVNTNTSTIYDGSKKLNINDNTQFLVRETNDKDEYVYVAYDRSTLPQYAKDSVDLFYTVSEKTGFVSRVYIKNAVDEADFGTHLFVLTDSYHKVTGKYNTYKMDVLVDGKEQTVCANEAIMKVLASNKNRLFHVEWEDADSSVGYYGFVAQARLINEQEDADRSYEDACDYVSGASKIDGNTIVSNAINWTVTKDTKFVGVTGIKDIDLDDDAVWVVAADDDHSAIAATVYVGVDAKLGTSTALTVDAANAEDKDGKAVADFGTATYDKDTKTWTVNFKEGVTAADLKLIGEDVMTLVNTGSTYANGTLTLDVNSTDDTKNLTVKVWNEAATTAEADPAVYTVVLNWYAAKTGNKIVSGDVDGSKFIIKDLKSEVENLQAAFTNANTLNLNGNDSVTLTVSKVSDGATVKMGAFVNTESIDRDKAVQMKADLTARNTITVENATKQTGGIIVVEVKSESGVCNYYVWKLVAGN